MGSRKAQTTYYWNADKEQVVCGCFKGTLSEFKKQVEEVYGSGKGYGADYLKWINSVEKYIKSL